MPPGPTKISLAEWVEQLARSIPSINRCDASRNVWVSMLNNLRCSTSKLTWPIWFQNLCGVQGRKNEVNRMGWRDLNWTSLIWNIPFYFQVCQTAQKSRNPKRTKIIGFWKLQVQSKKTPCRHITTCTPHSPRNSRIRFQSGFLALVDMRSHKLAWIKIVHNAVLQPVMPKAFHNGPNRTGNQCHCYHVMNPYYHIIQYINTINTLTHLEMSFINCHHPKMNPQ